LKFKNERERNLKEEEEEDEETQQKKKKQRIKVCDTSEELVQKTKLPFTLQIMGCPLPPKL
jgi:hypothetical protein